MGVLCSMSSPPSAITWTSGACPSNTPLSRARQLNQQKPSRRMSSILLLIITKITLPRRRRLTKTVQA
ncbi:aminoalcoholphosphotransferase [Histoplasma capsulatum G186AR]|uniref:Aminoalcoholphosphotransferase n=1 Tax=Ajellomyces capsulatus TaxID=5037 RepID=A0A8H8CYZ1_AJECA|nr:aminoalcoholphosphotransferase [Histoplasma capsulatum]QSS75305.1 aminoalcoholphosphotransferase [Histoplasma capsulatum G186AR]